MITLIRFRSLSLLFCLAILGACSSNPQNTVDPYEKWNRKVYAFNDGLDRAILKPLAKGYKVVTPDPVKTGVGNFFDNLSEISNVLNDILQWKWKQAGNDSGRFILNSTVGLLGFVDVARKLGLEKSDGEDFGQTLAVWGVPQGPYIMLPFLGPANVSSTAGLPLDWASNPVAYLNPALDRYAVAGLDLVQVRAKLLEAEDLISGDRYTFIRDAWMQRREFLINDGELDDDFGDDFGDEFGDEFE